MQNAMLSPSGEVEQINCDKGNGALSYVVYLLGLFSLHVTLEIKVFRDLNKHIQVR